MIPGASTHVVQQQVAEAGAQAEAKQAIQCEYDHGVAEASLRQHPAHNQEYD